MSVIGINAHLLSPGAGYRRAGIHHYIDQLLAHLPAGELSYFVYTRYRPSQQPSQTRFISTSWPTERRLVRIAWEQLALPLVARRDNVDLLHSMAFVAPYAAPCPTVVTVYDLSFVHFPESFPWLQQRYLQSQTRRSCRQARRVIAISQASRQDIHEHFGIPLARIDVVYPAVGDQFRQLSDENVEAFRARQGLPERFILHVGTLQPRKNIPLLIEAMHRIGRPDLHLVLVGGKGWLYDEIFGRVEALGMQNRVHFAGYVPDLELPLWYNAAAVLVFPSIYEGFGLPVLEAMACGTPVVSANTSAVPEVVGNAGRLFSPKDVSDLVSQILAVIDNPELAHTMRQDGLAQASRFSWGNSGRELAAVYERALNEDGRH